MSLYEEPLVNASWRILQILQATGHYYAIMDPQADDGGVDYVPVILWALCDHVDKGRAVLAMGFSSDGQMQILDDDPDFAGIVYDHQRMPFNVKYFRDGEDLGEYLKRIQVKIMKAENQANKILEYLRGILDEK